MLEVNEVCLTMYPIWHRKQQQHGGQQAADSSCSPSSIAETASHQRNTADPNGAGSSVQDCFEDLSTLEELLKIGDKSFQLMGKKTPPGNGGLPTTSAPPDSAAAASTGGPAQAQPQHNGGSKASSDAAGAGLKIVETHSLQR